MSNMLERTAYEIKKDLQIEATMLAALVLRPCF